MSSFGQSGAAKTAENNLGGTSNLALNNLFPQVTSAGSTALKTGAGNVNSGTGFLNTILNGSGENTAQLLQPSIDQIRGGTQQALQSTSTLMPRGGGRSGALFDLSTQPQRQIQGLFNQARTTAATALPQIGLGQEGVGTNLFNIGNAALGTATGANSSLGELGLKQQQIQNQSIQAGLKAVLGAVSGLAAGGGGGG